MDLSHIYQRTVDPNGTDSLAKLAKMVQPNSTILELGPATGYFTRYLTETLNCTVDCVEYSADMAEHARPMARMMWVGDLDQLELGEQIAPATYDFVIAADVLEHLRNPWRVMEMCRPLLKPDGRFLISIPNVGHAALIAELISGRFEYRDEGLLDRTHLRLFTRKSVLEMLQRCGYRPRSVGRVEWMAERTEFQRVLENCPPRLRDYLLSHPDSLTYQFIVNAEIGTFTDAEKGRLLEDNCGPTDPFFIAKVYWAGPGDLLNETRCHRRPIEIDKDRNLIQFDLPEGQPLAQLRFDPADRAGYLNLYRIEIKEVDGAGVITRTLVAMTDPNAIRQGCRLEDMVFDESSDEAFHIATNDDPQVWFEPSQPLAPNAGCALRFEAEISWPKSADYLAAARTIDGIVRHLRQEQRSSQKKISELQQALAAITSDLKATEQKCAALGQQAAKLVEIEPQWNQARNTLSEIYRSRAWKLVTAFRRIKHRILRR